MKKLLIVDDEEEISKTAKKFFERREMKVLTAENGFIALDIINKENPDLILLDITMEDISGVEVLKQLRADGNDVKVIMITGTNEPSVVNETNCWGICGYIQKPLILDELETIVLSSLNSSY